MLSHSRKCLDQKDEDQHQLNRHSYIINSDNRMRQLRKASTLGKDVNSTGVLNDLGSYLLRGLVAGILFEGSFIMFGFQKRVVRGVAANQLEQIRRMETQASQKIARGQVPQVPLELLRDSIRERIQKIKQDKSAKN